MDDDRVLRETLLRHLPEVDLEYAGRAPLVPADVDSDSTLSWWVHGTVEVEDHQDEGDWCHLPGVSLNEVAERDGTFDINVLWMQGLTIDTYEVADLADTLDARDADSAHFMPLIDPATGELAAEVQGLGFGSNLVIIDRVQVAPAWRGAGGVGRLLIATALRWLTHDAAVVAVHPHPYTLAEDPESDPRFPEALAAVRRTWASLGFEALPGHDDLWILDPASTALATAESELRRRLLGEA